MKKILYLLLLLSVHASAQRVYTLNYDTVKVINGAFKVTKQPTRVTGSQRIVAIDSITGEYKYIRSSNIAGSSYVFNNGLTNTIGTVGLGGTLLGTTLLNLNSNALAILDASGKLSSFFIGNSGDNSLIEFHSNSSTWRTSLSLNYASASTNGGVLLNRQRIGDGSVQGVYMGLESNGVINNKMLFVDQANNKGFENDSLSIDTSKYTDWSVTNKQWILNRIKNYGGGGGGGSVTSVFGRTGVITAQSGDYSGFYPLLTGSYTNPSWIVSIPWSKITATPTTLSGYGITDAYPLTGNPSGFSTYAFTGSTGQLTRGDGTYITNSSDNITEGTTNLYYTTARALLKANVSGQVFTGAISATNLSGTNTGDQTTITGNAGSATILQTGRTIGITGDLVYTSPSFNGSSNVTAAGTLATVNSNVGSFGDATHVPVFTVNAKGLITAVTNTTISAGGSGTVTSITPGVGFLSHTPITSSGTMDVDTASTIVSKTFAGRYPLKSTTIAGFDLRSNITLASHTVGYGLIGSAYNGATAQAWRVDTANVATRGYVNGLTQPLYFSSSYFNGAGTLASPYGIIYDSAPTSGSSFGATSGGIFTALSGKQQSLTLTTIGTSGAATLSGGTLNIPQYSGGGGGTPANPTASLGLTAINGSATTYMRSDAAPALSQSIVPLWTGVHTFGTTTAPASGVDAASKVNVFDNSGTGFAELSMGSTATSGYAGSGVNYGYIDASNVFNYLYGTGAESFNITDPSQRDYFFYDVTTSKYKIVLNATGAYFGDITTAATPTDATLGVVGNNVNLLKLTASTALALDASKNIISVTNTGSGNNVLATSPTLVTPVLGAATGTSLLLSGLTASEDVITDASKNLISNAITGTGNGVRATSPTLVTPALGVATGTSFNKVTITAPTTSATLTLVTGSSLITAGAFATTLTSTATTNSTLPAGTHTLAGLDVSQAFTGANTFKNASGIELLGTSSGTISLLGQAAAGTYNFNFPITAGTAGQMLTSQGGGSTAMTWVNPQTGLIIGTPTIVAGTGAGTSPTVSVTTNGKQLQVTVTTGTLPTGTNATIATVTLPTALSYTPLPVFSSASAATSLLNGASMVYMTSTGTANVTITSGTTALVAATTYIWNITL